MIERITTMQPKCGIVMPISECDGCPPEHWKSVLSIISETAIEAGYTPQLVSDSSDVGIIQRRIVQNLYDNEVIVCDVSGKNPNVMFELGMRLAFNKPAIIIKDNTTSYSFDTAPVEHLSYPRSLNYGEIISFRKGLVEKIKSSAENKYSFLDSFGKFQILDIKEESVPFSDLMLREIESIRQEIRFISNKLVPSGSSKFMVRNYSISPIDDDPDSIMLGINGSNLEENIHYIMGAIKSIPSVRTMREIQTKDNTFTFHVSSTPTLRDVMVKSISQRMDTMQMI